MFKWRIIAWNLSYFYSILILGQQCKTNSCKETKNSWIMTLPVQIVFIVLTSMNIWFFFWFFFRGGGGLSTTKPKKWYSTNNKESTAFRKIYFFLDFSPCDISGQRNPKGCLEWGTTQSLITHLQYHSCQHHFWGIYFLVNRF